MKSEKVTGESPYVRRLRRKAESVVGATAVYDAAFRAAVLRAWEQYRDGGPIVRRRCGLHDLLKEADAIFAQGNLAARHRMAKRDVQETYDVSQILKDAKDGYFIQVSGGGSGNFDDGDVVLIDHARLKARDGDVVAWGTLDSGLTVGFYFDDDDHETPLFGVAVALIRRYVRRRRSPRAVASGSDTSALRDKLDRLERLPENEAERFRLESEIYRAEQSSSDDEWPNVIGFD